MKNSFLLIFLFISFYSAAQEIDPATRGTIKVEKHGTLHSVLYDEVNFRLVCKDVYGNIIDTAVVSFDLHVTVKGIAYAENTAGCFISRPMQQRLSRMDGIVVLMFSNIVAKDKYGTFVDFPPFKVQTGYSREATDN